MAPINLERPIRLVREIVSAAFHRHDQALFNVDSTHWTVLVISGYHTSVLHFA